MVQHLAVTASIKINKGNLADKMENSIDSSSATFEQAITATGNGRFQLRVLLYAGLCLYAVLCETSNVAFLMPAAQCDLELTLREKGLLSAAVFVGFICSSHLWGMVGDTWGRRRTMLLTFTVDVATTVASALAPNYLSLLVLRFLAGFFICGPSGLFYVYLGEFYSDKLRARAIINSTAIGAAGMVTIPLMAWFVLPRPWAIVLPVTGFPTIGPWRIFLALCAMPSAITCLMLALALPESPKFLLSQGRNGEALAVLRAIYATNTGSSESNYPVKALRRDNDQKEGQRSGKKSGVWGPLHTVWTQTAPLFGPELRVKTALTSAMQFASFFGFNALVLWLPEMFNRMSAHQTGSLTLCDVMAHDLDPPVLLLDEALAAAGEAANLFPMDILEYNMTVDGSNNTLNTCDASVDEQVFINSILMSTAAFTSNTLSGLVLPYLGKNRLLVIWFLASGSLTASLMFIRSAPLLLTLYCVGVALGGSCPGVINAVVVDLFPTNLRGMAVCLSMMMGRLGVVCGTLAFGALLDVQCEPAFAMLSAALVGGALLAMQIPR